MRDASSLMGCRHTCVHRRVMDSPLHFCVANTDEGRYSCEVSRVHGSRRYVRGSCAACRKPVRIISIISRKEVERWRHQSGAVRQNGTSRRRPGRRNGRRLSSAFQRRHAQPLANRLRKPAGPSRAAAAKSKQDDADRRRACVPGSIQLSARSGPKNRVAQDGRAVC